MAQLNHENVIKFAFVPGYIYRIENGLFHNKFHFWTRALKFSKK
jgi:hypothetical protein